MVQKKVYSEIYSGKTKPKTHDHWLMKDCEIWNSWIKKGRPKFFFNWNELTTAQISISTPSILWFLLKIAKFLDLSLAFSTVSFPDFSRFPRSVGTLKCQPFNVEKSKSNISYNWKTIFNNIKFLSKKIFIIKRVMFYYNIKNNQLKIYISFNNIIILFEIK